MLARSAPLQEGPAAAAALRFRCSVRRSMGCAGSKDDDSPALRHGTSSSGLDTSTRKKAEAAVTTPNLDKLHSDAAAYMKASKGLKLDYAVQKEEASHQIQALSELNDAARAARESEESSSTRPSTSCEAAQPTTAPAATAAPEEEQEDGFEDISATAQQAPTAPPETERSFVDEDEDEDGAATRTRTAPDEEEGAARPSGFDPRGGRAATEGYEVIAEALVRAADGFGVAIGRAAVLGAAEHDCGMITALSGPAAASSLRVGDRIVAVDGEEAGSYQAAAAALEAAPGDVLLTVERPTARETAEAGEAGEAGEAEGGKEARRGGARRLRKVALGVRAAGQMKKGSSAAGEPAPAAASEQASPQAAPQASSRKGGSSLSSSSVRSKAAAAVAKLDAGSPGRASSLKALKKLDPLNVSGRLGGQLDRVGERLDKVGDRVNERLDRVSDNLDKVNLKRLDPLNVSGKLGGQLDRVSEKLDKVNLKKLDPLNVSGKLGERLDRLDGKLEKMRPSARRAAGPEAPAAAPEVAPPLVDPQLELHDMDI